MWKLFLLTGSTLHIVMLLEQDRATATDNCMHKFSHVVYETCKWTDRRTRRPSSQYFVPLSKGEVTMWTEASVKCTYVVGPEKMTYGAGSHSRLAFIQNNTITAFDCVYWMPNERKTNSVQSVENLAYSITLLCACYILQWQRLI